MRTQNTAGSSLFAFIAILYLVLLFGPSCQSKSTQSRKPPLKIAAFNVQVYGESKYGDTEVVTVLKKILSRYDLTFFQEIRDSKNKAFPGLMRSLQASYPWLAYVVSERLGRTTSKEQYAFIYNKNRLSVVEAYQYPDPKYEAFERPPYCIHVKSLDSVIPYFGVVGIHTKPEDAMYELGNLTKVYSAVSSRFGIQDILMLGDFNADCSYVNKGEMRRLNLRVDSRFTWLIGDGEDTTVYKTNCAYDRFVVAGTKLKEAVVPGSAKVYRFDTANGLSIEQAKDVSDHYPIEMQIYGKDSDDRTSGSKFNLAGAIVAAISLMTLISILRTD